MKNTALRANKVNCNGDTHTEILFKDSKHEDFFFNTLFQCSYQDTYHQALCYCLGLSSDTRHQAHHIYDFKTGCIKPDCLHEGWITSGSRRIILLAFNLYTDGTPTVDSDDKLDRQLCACREYSVSDLFCCGDARYFWEAIKLRYPEYVSR
ncbi:MAG: DUF6075 family protein [Clostridiales Family XIII bacterium]|jgi:hypothetical protein|nr:DUF6075 family protein [Clostridiales Family XIII bacterium]